MPSQEVENTTAPRKKGKKWCLFAAIIGIFFLLCILCTAGGYLAYKRNWFGLFETSEDEEVSMNDYLGLEVASKKVESYEELNDEVEDFYANLETLASYEESLLNASENEDADEFFASYEAYNKTCGELVSQTEAINDFFDDPNQDGDDAVGSIFVKPVSAAEESNFSYYTPVFGTLVEGHHEVVESARLDMWNYMNDDLSSIEREDKLAEYGLASMDDLLKAPDSKVKELASDPEIGGAINWGRASAKIADNAVLATLEGIFIGKMPANPVTFTSGYGSVKTIVLDHAKWMDEQKNPKQTTILLSRDAKDAIDKYLKEKKAREWEELKRETMREIAEEMKKMDKPVVAANQNEESTVGNEVKVPEGSWDVINAVTETITVMIESVEVIAEEMTEISIPYNNYYVDPEIAKYLGFNVEIETGGDIVYSGNACDYPDGLTYEAQEIADQCYENLESCTANPISIGEGYAQCISAGGGCWDIPRWNWLENPEACDNWKDKYPQGTQDYNDAYEYCTCIDNCKAQYYTQRNCDQEFSECCDSIEW